jgi:HK97 gp10 family phage protein
MSKAAEIKGLKQLKIQIRKTERGIKTHIKQALVEAMTPMKKKAKALAPVGTSRAGHTAGTLRRGIIIRTTVTSRKQEARLGLSARAWYGKFVEFGTKFQRAQPFMRPAYQQEKRRAVFVFRDIMRSKVFKKVGTGRGIQF